VALASSTAASLTIGLWKASPPGGVNTERVLATEPFRDGAWYAIDDDDAQVLVGVAKGLTVKVTPSAAHGRFSPRKDQALEGLSWWTWQPLSPNAGDIGRARRYGYFTTEVTISDGKPGPALRVELRCIVLPARFFDAGAYQRILQEIKREFGRPVEWDRTEDTVRTPVATTPGAPTGPELLRDVRDELRAANVLTRLGHLDDASAGALKITSVPTTPEATLVGMWARRRISDLAKLRRGLEVHPLAIDGNQKRAKRDGDAAAVRAKDSEHAAALAGALSAYARSFGENRCPFSLTPAMQRDHRLRRLLRAFAPPQQEGQDLLQRQGRSLLPPLVMPDIFELWSVARIARALEILGWERREQSYASSKAEGASGPIERHRVTFAQHGDVLTFEYRTKPDVLSTDGAPPMHRRRTALIDWACGDASETAGLVASQDLTPDFALFLTQGRGPTALAIGDATLSDPKHAISDDRDKGTRAKFDKMVTYRENIRWKVGGRVIASTAATTFVVLPGPAERWSDAGEFVANDAVTLFLDPHEESHRDLPTLERIDGLILAMRAACQPQSL